MEQEWCNNKEIFSAVVHKVWYSGWFVVSIVLNLNSIDSGYFSSELVKLALKYDELPAIKSIAWL